MGLEVTYMLLVILCSSFNFHTTIMGCSMGATKPKENIDLELDLELDLTKSLFVGLACILSLLDTEVGNMFCHVLSEEGYYTF